jgi:hypothetical protein
VQQEENSITEVSSYLPGGRRKMDPLSISLQQVPFLSFQFTLAVSTGTLAAADRVEVL